MVRDYWTHFQKKKNEIVDCDDVEAIVAFKHDVSDEFLSRDFGYYKPKTKPILMGMVTRHITGEDTWLAN